MLDELKTFFREGMEYTHTAGILQQLSTLLNIVNTQYTKDENARNAAIDLICQMLQSHKVSVQAQENIQEVPN